MTIGPATLIAAIAAGLATLVWAIATRLGWHPWVGMFLFGLMLVLVLAAGPLVRLP